MGLPVPMTHLHLLILIKILIHTLPTIGALLNATKAVPGDAPMARYGVLRRQGLRILMIYSRAYITWMVFKLAQAIRRLPMRRFAVKLGFMNQKTNLHSNLMLIGGAIQAL